MRADSLALSFGCLRAYALGGMVMAGECNDKKCYIHSNVRVRGGRLTGIVRGKKMKNTVSVEIPRVIWFPKYKRYARARSVIHAHNPSCINAEVGDTVIIGETRRLSKTKAWTVLSVVKGKEAQQAS